MKRQWMMFSSKQRGFSIVEMLIAGTLGLILLAGVLQLFLGSNRNYSLQGELASVQEDGRFALNFLEDQIQMSSWTEDFLNIQPAVDLDNSSDGTNDSVTVTRQVAVDGTSNLDCNGVEVTSGKVSNKFYVDNGSLMCQGNGGGTAQPFIGNVESFQVLYGVETDLDCPDGAVNQYMTRTTLLASTQSSVYKSRIVAIRIGLVLKSEQAVLDTAKQENFTLLDQDYQGTTDRFVRRTFQQTIFMPNAVYASTGSPDAIISCMQSNI